MATTTVNHGGVNYKVPIAPQNSARVRQIYNQLAKKERAEAWRVAIGLQAVDGLKVSDYLLELARRNIEGEISMEEVDKLLDEYYEEKHRIRDSWREYETYTKIDVQPDPEGSKRGRPL